MNLREVRRRKRRIHLAIIAFLCTTLGIVLFANIGIFMATDIANNTYPEVIAIDPALLDENDPAIEPEKPKVAHQGTIYLTFDDGPSAYTSSLLDTLKKYSIKATFFVTKNGDDAVLLREYDEGHAIGLHSFSHNYAAIYSNADNFLNDLAAIQARVESVTGQQTPLMRFPGGSSNTVSRRYDKGAHIMTTLAKAVTERGYTYFDWNVDSDDAGAAKDSDAVYNNVIARLKSGDNIILQHDVKSYSVEAVERIIEYGLSHGYDFDKLNKDSFPAHHAINN